MEDTSCVDVDNRDSEPEGIRHMITEVETQVLALLDDARILIVNECVPCKKAIPPVPVKASPRIVMEVWPVAGALVAIIELGPAVGDAMVRARVMVAVLAVPKLFTTKGNSFLLTPEPEMGIVFTESDVPEIHREASAIVPPILPLEENVARFVSN